MKNVEINFRHLQNISLRDIQSKDAAVLMEMNNDPQIAKFVVETPTRVSLSEQLEWMKRINNEKNTKRFMIDCENQTVGTIIISNINTSNRIANMNIKILPDFWGKGIGSSSLIMALDYCFKKMSLECVTAHVLPYNKASLSLFSRIGFKKEGILRSRVQKEDLRYDLISFSILRTEFYNTSILYE